MLKQTITFLYGIFCLACIAALFSFGIPRNQQPLRTQYIMRSATLDKIQQNTVTLYQYLDASNLPQQEAKQLKALLQENAQLIEKDKSDSTLNR